MHPLYKFNRNEDEENKYAELAKQFEKEAQEDFIGYETRETLKESLRKLDNTRDYFETQQAIWAMQFTEYNKVVKLLRERAQDAQALTEKLSEIQRELTQKVLECPV